MVLVNPGDAPSITKLCSGQDGFYHEMREEMDEPRRRIYGEYFQLCKDKFVNLFPSPPLVRIQDQQFYNVMDRALSEENPAVFYENNPLVNKLVFGFIKLLPVNIGDRARLAIMKLPKYESVE